MIWNPKWFPGTNLQDLNLDWILKKIAALRGGTAGQYLYKKSDKDFDFGWKTGSGGGGGTSDYLDLDNKPSINNVELTGNKTASDLGLATPSDIPVVPVQSVNGKTGAVVLDSTDVGAGTYSKPATGIPKTDLSSAVQTSLDKADTALQAVPSTYRTAAAQDVIDAAQNAEIEKLAGSLAKVESSPATTAHVVGEYIVFNGQLYKVTAAIAPGATLTVGTNISAVSGGGLNDIHDILNIHTFGAADITELRSGISFNNNAASGYVIGNLCVFNCIISSSSADIPAYTNLFRLPYHPKSETNFLVMNNNVFPSAMGFIKDTGYVQMRSTITASNYIPIFTTLLSI